MDTEQVRLVLYQMLLEKIKMKHISEFQEKYKDILTVDHRDLEEKILQILQERDFEIDSLKEEIRRLNEIK